jgi:hypothetical protein
MAMPEDQGQKLPLLLHNTAMADNQIEALNAVGFVWQLCDLIQGRGYNRHDEDAGG